MGLGRSARPGDNLGKGFYRPACSRQSWARTAYRSESRHAPLVKTWSRIRPSYRMPRPSATAIDVRLSGPIAAEMRCRSRWANPEFPELDDATWQRNGVHAPILPYRGERPQRCGGEGLDREGPGL